MALLRPSTGLIDLCSEANTRELVRFYVTKIGFKNLGQALEFRVPVGIGKFGVMVARLCLNMVS